MALFKHIAAGTFEGEIWTFTMHSDGTLAVGDAADLWETATATFWNAISTHINEDTVMVRATTVTLDPGTGAQLTRRDRDVTRPGTSIEASLPYQVTAVVSLRTDDASRRGRGRFYTPSFDVVSQAAGRLTAGAQGDLADGAEAMLEEMQSGGLAPVLLSRDTMETREIIRLDVGDVLDTQRRRRNGLTESRVTREL